MPSTNKTARPSLTDGGLEGLYKAAPSIANVGGGSAKDAGTSKTQVNAINGGPAGTTGDVAQKGFVIKQAVQVTQFTDKGLNYGNTLGVDTTKYKG
jgi:hypothetical protein